MSQPLHIAEEVATALAEKQPVVALESTLIAHGLPAPQNLRTAQKLEALVRHAGAVPATVAVLDGRLRVGLDAEGLARIATDPDVVKVSRRDLAPLLARGGSGATTVAATMIAAAAAGIAIFATGGIGGVHRGGELSLDISADLVELSRTSLAVVCSGAKSILDLPRTLEVLETHGVPVIGYGCDSLPAFYLVSSGLALEARVESAAQAAAVIATHRQIALAGGLVIAVPIPAVAAIDSTDLDVWTTSALAEAERDGIAGKAVTPYLLRRLFELSDGRTLQANIALIENNAVVAAEIAVALSITGN